MKHKHADLIHQWADGAEIQCRYKESPWLEDKNPEWSDEWEYRIKPEEKKPVVRWLWAHKEGQSWRQLHTYATELEASMNKLQLVKLEWSRTEFPE